MMLLLFGLLACNGESDDDSGVDSVDTNDSAGETEFGLVDFLDEAGFVVQEGVFQFSVMDGCCEPDAQCFGNNTTTPYGTHAVPPAPGHSFTSTEIISAWGAAPEGMQRTFKLRQDEALLMVGPPPPSSTYLGYRAYLGVRPSMPYPLIGSLGSPLNNQFYPDMFDQDWAVITSFDEGVEDLVLDQVAKAGMDGMVFKDRISTDVANPGLDADADSFFTVMRVALYDDQAAGDAFLEQPPWTVYRLTPKTEMTTERPFPKDILNEKGSGTTEDDWLPALEALEDGLEAWVAETYDQPFTLKQLTHDHVRDTYDCMDDPLLVCTGELRDRWVAPTYPFVVGEKDVIISYGINHHATGKATYMNTSIQTILNQVGIASFSSDAMPGTAADFVDHPLEDDLYVSFFARDCTDLPYPCFEVPDDECPGAPLNGELKISVRAYLEPATGAAPIVDELVLDRVVKVFGGLP